MTEKLHFLYHLRDPETSAGFGFDGYGGTTNDFHRRFREHMRSCSKGHHPNPKVQKLYDGAGGNLQMRIVRIGTKEEVLASEALVFNRKDKHANIQPGGGYLRGMSEDELIRRAGLGKAHAESLKWRSPESKVSKQQIALIVAAGIAIAAGAYYGYRYYKKRTRSTDSSAEHLIENSRVEPKNDEAERQARAQAQAEAQARAAARLAKAKTWLGDLPQNDEAERQARARAQAQAAARLAKAKTWQGDLPQNDEAERQGRARARAQAQAEARLAKARTWQGDLKSTNRALLGTLAAYAALLTAAYHVASDE